MGGCESFSINAIVIFLIFLAYRPNQMVQTQIRLLINLQSGLIRVFTVSDSSCILLRHYTKVRNLITNFRVFTSKSFSYLNSRIFIETNFTSLMSAAK